MLFHTAWVSVSEGSRLYSSLNAQNPAPRKGQYLSFRVIIMMEGGGIQGRPPHHQCHIERSPSTTALVFACHRVESLAFCIPGTVSAITLRPLPPVSLQRCPWPAPLQPQSFLAQTLSTDLSAGSSSWALPWPISLSLSLKQAAGKPGFGSLPRAEGFPASAGPARSKESDCLLDRVPRVPLLQCLHQSLIHASLGSGPSNSAASTTPETLLHQSPWPPFLPAP